jgi:hypothetical protein
MANKQLIDILMGKLSMAFPVELTDELLSIYEEYLQDIESEELKYAINGIITNGKFFPKISEIREEVIKNRFIKENIPSAADAWSEVQRQIHDKGYYQLPIWTHPIVEEVMETIGGWSYLTSALEINLETVRAQFLRIFESKVSRLKTNFNLLPETKNWLKGRKKVSDKLMSEINQEMINTIDKTIKSIAEKSCFK